MRKFGNFEGVDSFETQPGNKVETIPSATENDRRKLEHIGKISGFGSKHGTDLDKEKAAVDKGPLNKRDANKISENNGDLVQSGTALENPKYGDGGGKQYFIPDAARKPARESDKIPLKNGFLEKAGETNLQYDGSSNHLENGNRSKNEEKSKIEEQKIKPTVTVDTSPLSKSEEDEWKEFDKNTLDERGLPKAMPNGEQQEKENWKHAHSNQENRGPGTYPDAWSNPRELKDGEKFYQLRPLKEKDASDFFTDAETVNKCRDRNGNVNAGKLLNALQINPGNNKNWTLRDYIYHKNK